MSKVVPHKAAPPQPASYKAFDNFVDELDELADDHLALGAALAKAKRDAEYAPGTALKTIADAIASLSYWAGVPNQESIRRCRDFWNQYYEWEDDDDDALLRGAVSKAVALLLGSFPNTANIPDPKVYTRMMIEEIIAYGAGMPIIESALREIRRTATFPPAIGEVIRMLDKHRALWGKRISGLALDGRYKEALKLKETLEQRLNPQLQHQPVETLVVGVPMPVGATKKGAA